MMRAVASVAIFMQSFEGALGTSAMPNTDGNARELNNNRTIEVSGMALDSLKLQSNRTDDDECVLDGKKISCYEYFEKQREREKRKGCFMQ